MSRFAIALFAFAVLAGLTCVTLDDARLRWATLAILGLFVFKTVVRHKDVMHPDGEQDTN